MTEIKDTVEEDLVKLSICHKSAFPDSLSSKMGISYLTKMIAWYLSDNKRILFHIEENNICIGYCGGMIIDGTQPMGSASGMMQHSFYSAVIAIALRPWLIFHKEFLNKYKLILKNIRKKFRQDKKRLSVNMDKKEKVIIEKEMGLVVIGVASEYHGKGIGSQLLREFEIRTAGMNIKKMGLAVKKKNEKALNSYQRNGWIISKEYDDYFEMTKRIIN